MCAQTLARRSGVAHPPTVHQDEEILFQVTIAMLLAKQGGTETEPSKLKCPVIIDSKSVR